MRQPVLNTPYEPTKWHWQLGSDNRAMAKRLPRRRPSLGLLPVPASPENVASQQALQLSPKDLNATVNDIRDVVARWRDRGYQGATDTTQRLLWHWRDENNQPRLFFAQVEALETLIWLTEVAGPGNRLRQQVEQASREHNDGIVRYAVKMATGTGKTTVMGMVIAWNAVNAPGYGSRRRNSRSNRYHTCFAAIAPGHTVRERLAVLNPSHPQNIYDEMSLVPDRLRPKLGRVKLRVVNFQAFQRRDRLGDATGDARRLLRRSSKRKEPERPTAMLARVLRGLYTTGAGGQRVCVLNDEAHHCYLPERGRRTGDSADDDKTAALWFNALAALRDEGRLGPVFDFSATPMFINTTSRKKSVMFPWVLSDFPLMDAIEAGLVKIPRVPVEDDADGIELKWRNLYKHTQPKKVLRHSVPPVLAAALDALYAHYETTFEAWQRQQMPTPPVFIVVANSIPNAEALYQHLSGWSEEPSAAAGSGVRRGAVDGGADDTKVFRPGARDLFCNYTTEGPGPLRTLLVHSKLEGNDNISAGSKLGKAIKAQAKQLQAAGASGNDREVMREALNTVGRPGELGESIRCVVSVSMLTEGWDTRTVTHILGFRAFSTQLLCEQVTGRALRRSNYDSFDDKGRLTPEFADVLGVPYDFMPTGGSADPAPPKPRYRVHTMADRRRHRIEFPALTGYMIEPSGQGVMLDPHRVKPYSIQPDAPTIAELAGVAGETDLIGREPDPRSRRQQAEMNLAAAVTNHLQQILADESATAVPADPAADAALPPRWQWGVPRRLCLFRDCVKAARAWLDHPDVDCGPGRADIGWLLSSPQVRDRAAQQIADACLPNPRTTRLRVIGCFDNPPVRDTSDVDFETSLSNRYPPEAGHTTTRSELNAAACHSRFERLTAAALDRHREVRAWARNFRLDWTVPYRIEDVWHQYVPDFVVRLFADARSPHAVHLMLECKGLPDKLSQAKHDWVRNWWIPAVAGSPQTPAHLRRWLFAELTDPSSLATDIDRAVEGARRLVSTAPAADAA